MPSAAATRLRTHGPSFELAASSSSFAALDRRARRACPRRCATPQLCRYAARHRGSNDFLILLDFAERNDGVSAIRQLRGVLPLIEPSFFLCGIRRFEHVTALIEQNEERRRVRGQRKDLTSFRKRDG